MGSGIPSSPGTARWRPADRWWLAVRALLLLVLAAAAVVVAGSAHMPYRQQDDLLADLAAGRVSYVVYEPATNGVSWATGLWSWQRTDINHDVGGAPQEWLDRQVAASPHRPTVTISRDEGPVPSDWLYLVPWQPLRTAAVLAWTLTFALMLARRDHRYANRWAWFWLFTVGQIGALLYLVLEPHPAWRPPSAEARGRPRLDGRSGCLGSMLLTLALGAAAAAIGALW